MLHQTHWQPSFAQKAEISLIKKKVYDFSCRYRNNQHCVNHVLCSQLRKECISNPFSCVSVVLAECLWFLLQLLVNTPYILYNDHSWEKIWSFSCSFFLFPMNHTGLICKHMIFYCVAIPKTNTSVKTTFRFYCKCSTLREILAAAFPVLPMCSSHLS